MAVIGKTVIDTLRRLGEGCVADLMQLHSPKDKTKDGSNLLTLCLNAGAGGKAEDLVDKGWVLQPQLTDAKALGGFVESLRSKGGLGKLKAALPKGNFASRILELPLWEVPDKAFCEALAAEPELPADALAGLFASGVSKMSIGSEKELAQAMDSIEAIAMAIAGDPKADIRNLEALKTAEAFGSVFGRIDFMFQSLQAVFGPGLKMQGQNGKMAVPFAQSKQQIFKGLETRFGEIFAKAESEAIRNGLGACAARKGKKAPRI